MSNRITQRDLDGTVARLNTALDRPAESWVKGDDGRYHANIGNLHLDGAYGGWELHEMVTDGGGIHVLSSGGHVSKRELYQQLHAMLNVVYAMERTVTA